jgi:hypothetical protein
MAEAVFEVAYTVTKMQRGLEWIIVVLPFKT